jgi:hypothetical protein
VSHLHSLQSYTPVFHSWRLHIFTLQINIQFTRCVTLSYRELNCLALTLKTAFLDIPVPLIKSSIVKRHCSNEPGESCVVSLAETRRSRDIPLLLLPGDVTAACCVVTVFQCCCVTSSHLRGNLVYRLVLGNGLRNFWCVSQQWVDMSQYVHTFPLQRIRKQQ